MRTDFPSSTAPVETVTMFSETLAAATGYAGGVVTLSDGTRVIFANESVSVQTGGAGRRRAVRR